MKPLVISHSIAIALVLAATTTAVAQQTDVGTRCQPSGEAIRSKAAELLKSTSDANAIIRALDKEAGYDVRDATGSFTIHYSDDLFIALMTPYSSYRFALVEALRKRDAIDNIGYPPGVQIGVLPKQIDAPDIEKIIVERDGQAVTATANDLRVVEMSTRMGVKRAIHSGGVWFGCDAFAPGGKVVVTAIPSRGSNIAKEFKDAELRKITGAR